jgi:hypothetical protein
VYKNLLVSKVYLFFPLSRPVSAYDDKGHGPKTGFFKYNDLLQFLLQNNPLSKG